MPILDDFPLSTSFAGILSMQSLGVITTGDASPAGIPGGLDIVDGYALSSVRQADPPTAGGIRSEILLAADFINNERFYTWDVYLPSADWVENATPLFIGQVHQKDSISSSVNVAVVAQNFQWNVWVPSTPPPVISNFTYLVTPAQNIQFDCWNSFALHCKWENNDTGFIELYINRVAVFKRFDVGTAYDSDAPYFKLGIYDATHAATFGSKKVRFRNVKKWGGNDGYEIVMGGTQIPSPQLQEP